MSDDRERLAQSQADLAAALAGRGDAPKGFDVSQVELARKGLERKRLATLHRAMPRMTETLAGELEQNWSAYIASYPVAEDPTADACAFAGFLLKRNLFPESAMIELVHAELRAGRRLVLHLRPVACVGVRLLGRSFVKASRL